MVGYGSISISILVLNCRCSGDIPFDEHILGAILVSCHLSSLVPRLIFEFKLLLLWGTQYSLEPGYSRTFVLVQYDMGCDKEGSRTFKLFQGSPKNYETVRHFC